jgi:hypothetical protein
MSGVVEMIQLGMQIWEELPIQNRARHPKMRFPARLQQYQILKHMGLHQALV